LWCGQYQTCEAGDKENLLECHSRGESEIEVLRNAEYVEFLPGDEALYIPS
jgi:predicted RNase H-like HicB family nuclease